jgi:thiol-disulfide isomerase/thioredoxin
MVVALIALGFIPALAQEWRRFECKIAPKLVPHPAWEVATLFPPSPEETAMLPEGMRIYSTLIPLHKGVKVKLAVIESRGGDPAWFLDRNLDGDLSKDEQIPMSKTPYRVELPLPGGPFPTAPVDLKLIEVTAKQADDISRHDARFVYYSMGTDVLAYLNVNGTEVPFYYWYNQDNFSVNLADTWLGVDTDGDGTIDRDLGNVECANAKGRKVVFQVQGRYFRTESLDLASKTAVIQEVPGSEYRLIRLRIGEVLPDFTFVDFSGATHTLRESKSKYTLLYFWATWCPICVREVPVVNAAQEHYAKLGFRIIGLNKDEDLERATQFVRDKGATWMQARYESIQELVDQRMRVEDWPTAILLDENFRIISMNKDGQLHIRGTGLLPTLDKLYGGPRN